MVIVNSYVNVYQRVPLFKASFMVKMMFNHQEVFFGRFSDKPTWTFNGNYCLSTDINHYLNSDHYMIERYHY